MNSPSIFRYNEATSRPIRATTCPISPQHHNLSFGATISMKRRIRILLATLSFLAILALFLDFTGVLGHYLGWIAKIQWIPAILAFNFVAFLALLGLTLIFGRIYCSILCPLGIFQDLFAAFRGKKRKYAYWSMTKPLKIARYALCLLFIALIAVGGLSIAAYVEPYSAFGRMASSLFAPIYDAANNAIAAATSEHENLLFYDVSIWVRGFGAWIAALLTFVAMVIAGIATGRGYCAHLCPVGTMLGVIARFSLGKIRIDDAKCKGCRACANRCPAHCLDVKTHRIDPQRCIACMSCLEPCRHDAIHYTFSVKNMGLRTPMTREKTPKSREENPIQTERRKFVATTAGCLVGVLLHPRLGQAAETEGNLAPVSRKDPYPRETPIVPPGAKSRLHLDRHCTDCMLCIRACHNQVLRIEKGRPTLSFERGFCRPSCTDCSQVCPNGAIEPITPEQKTSLQIGRAIWKADHCLSANGAHCRACLRACPNGAIHFVSFTNASGKIVEIPSVDMERCIGCGACEYVCPARPLAAIHVEGNLQHRTV